MLTFYMRGINYYDQLKVKSSRLWAIANKTEFLKNKYVQPPNIVCCCAVFLLRFFLVQLLFSWFLAT